jgi:hypothetical protein
LKEKEAGEKRAGGVNMDKADAIGANGLFIGPGASPSNFVGVDLQAASGRLQLV